MKDIEKIPSLLLLSSYVYDVWICILQGDKNSRRIFEESLTLKNLETIRFIVCSVAKI